MRIIFSICFVFCFSFFLKAQKTDVLYMMNGDVITGEIKSLDFGKLKYKTDHASTIYVDWEDIVTLKSKNIFIFGLRGGERILGSIDSSGAPGHIIILLALGTRKVDMNEIVTIGPVKNTFWSRIDGNIESGMSYTKASDVLQVNGSFNAEYKGQNFITGYRSTTILTTQPDKEDNRKSDLSIYITRMYNNNWYAQLDATAESNTELGLGWRTLSGGNAGHDFIRTVYSRFSGGIGVYFNGEKGTDSSTVTSSVESAFSLSYKVVRYNVPKIDIYTTLNVYPSLTEAGRVRAQYDLKTKFEIIADLYFSVDFYYTYDNQPRSVNASKNDYGVIASVGYKF